ncbi:MULTISPECIES: sugar phosphate isomerase/epimerase [Frigoribacterium]|uniref:sugar phosphate isomerase/epimerase family protein n=1 Tax=Frigoribacterium TaxID=96492 RepID=UPI0017860DF4|nr:MULTISPECIES: sugar phosphate isomerase/epimerase [Frigoribacterium]MBD8702605.1 sugar phosphate isomerase/epimerase [Frigoribacterium sp. CFBP 13712]MCJ0700767.1 sugar phosphate isomerase/epimerase [Frigoribacterium faeni]MDY0892044.1 sugar phosphate isomerase/epimerase [Frigoribacterium sp. CFBP9030]
MTSPISVQLYTVRDAIAADLPGTLQRLADIGYTQVEPWGFVERVDEYAEALPAAGLTAPSAHAKLVGQDLQPIFEAAVRLGVSTVIDPHIDETRWITREDVEAVAAELGEVAEAARAHGLTVGYHNHAFELENLIDGTPALEVFAAALPADVVLEIDTYWVEVGGVDAAELLARLGDRVRFLHIKDGPKTKDDTEQVAVGRGTMPVRDILRAAPQALAVVELDDHNGDVFTALEQSHSFLDGVRA